MPSIIRAFVLIPALWYSLEITMDYSKLEQNLLPQKEDFEHSDEDQKRYPLAWIPKDNDYWFYIRNGFKDSLISQAPKILLLSSAVLNMIFLAIILLARPHNEYHCRSPIGIFLPEYFIPVYELMLMWLF